MEDKDKEIDRLRKQVKALYQKNSTMLADMVQLQNVNSSLLKEVYQLLKKADENFEGFKKHFEDAPDDDIKSNS